ncbi:MAG: nucleoside deaminase [Candidatus Micrarchaeia archaeon]
MAKAEDEGFMRLALRECVKGVRAGGGPFGCVVVKGGRVVARAHNTVVKSRDATAHAEVNAIRLACRKLKSHVLRGCTVYATTEPCPMCFSAIHWAQCDRIVFGASMEDAAAAGLNELLIHDVVLKRLGRDPVKLTGGVLRSECARVLREWGRRPESVKY